MSLLLQSVACRDPANNGIFERGYPEFLASYLVMLKRINVADYCLYEQTK